MPLTRGMVYMQFVAPVLQMWYSRAEIVEVVD